MRSASSSSAIAFPEKAMLLAAGFGERLRPLTLTTPKPLIPIRGSDALIEYNLSLLFRAGVRSVLINLHYLGEKISAYLGDGSRYGLKICYSKEEEILGTGGGVRKALPFFGKEPFFLMNADILIDLSLPDFFRFHVSTGAKASLVVLPVEPDTQSPAQSPTQSSRKPVAVRNWVFVEDDFVSAIAPSLKNPSPNKIQTIFTGVHCLDPVLIDLLPAHGFSDLVEDLYVPMLAAGTPLGAYRFSGYWQDVGTFERYEQVQQEFKNAVPPFLKMETR